MSKDTLFQMCQDLRPYIQKRDTKYRKTIPINIRITSTLYKLAQGCTLLSCSKHFAIGMSTMLGMIRQVARAINIVHRGGCLTLANVQYFFAWDALWTKAVGMHLVGRCILYSCHFLDLMIWWLTTGNGWNMRQHTWPKSIDVKSLQSWASQTCRASGRWGQSMKSLKAPSKKFGAVGRTHCNVSFVAKAYRDICWIWKC